jgi:hypothetical protein
MNCEIARADGQVSAPRQEMGIGTVTSFWKEPLPRVVSYLYQDNLICQYTVIDKDCALADFPLSCRKSRLIPVANSEGGHA